MAYCVESAEMVMKERGLMTEDGELSEEMLEAVAGGGAFLDSMAGIIGGGIWIGLGIAYKTCGAAAICATIGTGCCVIGGVLVLAGVAIGAAAIYKKYKKKK